MSDLLKNIIKLVVVSILLFALHYLSQIVFESLDSWKDSPINLIQIYFVEFLISILTLIVIFAVKKVSSNNIGFAFLGLMTLRLIISYVFIKPILKLGEDYDFVKYHFLLIFFLYLTFDVYVTYILLKENGDVEKNSTKQ